jgi:hypothetical protein
VIADELAYWFTDGSYANPDVEILAAARPGLLTTHGMLIMASSPYARRGVLWDVYKKHFGPQGAPAILVAQGTSRDFNSTLDQAEIDRALDADPVRNRAEYLAEFRSDIESYIGMEAIEACLGDYREMLPAPSTKYFAFTDPSGGSGEDSFAIAIAHRLDSQVIIDCIREVRPRFSPTVVIDDFALLLQSYRINKVTGDRFAGEFPREQFRKHGISYQLAKQPKSDLFRDLLPLINSKSIVLPQNDRLIAQLIGLERQTTRAGRDSIDHAPGAHDDIVNAVAGVASLCHKPVYDSNYEGWQDMPDPCEQPTTHPRPHPFFGLGMPYIRWG